MSDSESDIEISSALPKMKMQKPPKSPSEDTKTKKITTKIMIIDALIELKTRKGVSLYAIKKHLTDKYEVNTDKVNYLIKKTIKAGVEDGTFVQMKGIGAAGSFKLAIKETTKTKKKPAKPKEKKEKTKAKATIIPEKKTKKLEKKTGIKADDKKTKEARKPKKMDVKKTDKPDDKKEKKVKKVIKAPEKEEKQETGEKKKKKVKIAKGIPTPSKKSSTMMKRKSIGSIIKPPKMKPKKA